MVGTVPHLPRFNELVIGEGSENSQRTNVVRTILGHLVESDKCQEMPRHTKEGPPSELDIPFGHIATPWKHALATLPSVKVFLPRNSPITKSTLKTAEPTIVPKPTSFWA